MPLARTATEVVTKTASGDSINAGIWTLVGVVVTTIGVVWIAYIKQWGPWKQAESDSRAADFARLRDDIARQDARIERLEGQVEKADRAASAANEHAMRSDAKLHTALTACEVLLSLVEREMPEAKEIPLVKRLLAQAASDDLGIGNAMRKIAMMEGVGQ